MNLKEKIQIDKNNALKSKEHEKRSVLSVILGELDRKSKNPSDLDVISIIKKMIETNKITNNTDENKYLEIYLPTKIEGEKLKTLITEIITSVNALTMKDMGKVMGTLTKQYPGQYDGKEASNVVKSLLS